MPAEKLEFEYCHDAETLRSFVRVGNTEMPQTVLMARDAWQAACSANAAFMSVFEGDYLEVAEHDPDWVLSTLADGRQWHLVINADNAAAQYRVLEETEDHGVLLQLEEYHWKTAPAEMQKEAQPDDTPRPS